MRTLSILVGLSTLLWLLCLLLLFIGWCFNLNIDNVRTAANYSFFATLILVLLSNIAKQIKES